MSLINFLPLRREVRSHWTYKDNDYFKIWVEMLFCARFSEDSKTDIYNGQLYTINYSELLFSRRTWADRLNTTEGKIRKFVDLAIKDEMITQVGRIGKKGATIYKINNYKTYNFTTHQEPTQEPTNKGLGTNSHPPLTHQEPTANPPLTTKEECKNEKTKYTTEFNQLYNDYPRAENKAQTYNNYKKLLKEYSHSELLKCVSLYNKKVRKEKTEKQYMTSSSNFFGKKAVYLDYIAEEKEVKQPILVDAPKRVSMMEVINGRS